jgi:hypothetical protein
LVTSFKKHYNLGIEVEANAFFMERKRASIRLR